MGCKVQKTQGWNRENWPVSKHVFWYGSLGRQWCGPTSVRRSHFTAADFREVELADAFVTLAETPKGQSSRRKWRRVCVWPISVSMIAAVHAGFEKVGLELWNAGTESKQLEELTSCNPGGSDSPKLRTASARSGGT
jgi:hypothetical protein